MVGFVFEAAAKISISNTGLHAVHKDIASSALLPQQRNGRMSE